MSIYFSDDDEFDFDETYNNNNNNNNVHNKKNPSPPKHYDDDNDYDSDTNNQTPVCINCGSTHFYRDTNTDALICTQCYTQSQSQSQREVTDYDTAIELAATNVKGKLIGRRRGRRSSGFTGDHVSDRLKQDWELDKSTSLPTEMECCVAYQRVLQVATRCIADLACPVPIYHGPHQEEEEQQQQQQKRNKQKKQFQKNLLQRVQRIWFQYLTKWNEAASHYSQLYPELRLCFRDYFLNKNVRVMLMKYLSSKAISGIQKCLVNLEKERHDGRKRGREDDLYTSMMEGMISHDGRILSWYVSTFFLFFFMSSRSSNKVHQSDRDSNKDDNSDNNDDDEDDEDYVDNDYHQSPFTSSSKWRNVDMRRRKRTRSSTVRWVDNSITSTKTQRIVDENNGGDKKRKMNEDKEKFPTANNLQIDFELTSSSPFLNSQQSKMTTDSGCQSSNHQSKEYSPTVHKIEPHPHTYFRKPITTIESMLKQSEGRVDENTIDPYYAIFKLKPDLNLLSSII